MDEAIRLDAKDPFARAARSHAYLAKGDVDAALADLNEGVRLDPKNPEVLNVRSTAYLQRGELGKALADANQIVPLLPNNAKAYLVRSWVFRARETTQAWFATQQRPSALTQNAPKRTLAERPRWHIWKTR